MASILHVLHFKFGLPALDPALVFAYTAKTKSKQSKEYPQRGKVRLCVISLCSHPYLVQFVMPVFQFSSNCSAVLQVQASHH